MQDSDFFKHCSWHKNSDLWKKLKSIQYNERKLHGSLVNSLLLGDFNACKNKINDLKTRYNFHINQDLVFAGNYHCCCAIDLVYSFIFEQNKITYANALKMFDFLVKEGAEINSSSVSLCFTKLNFVVDSIFEQQLQFLQLLLKLGATCNKNVFDFFFKENSNKASMIRATYFFLQNGFTNPKPKPYDFCWNDGFDICSQWYLVMPLYCLEKKGIHLFL